MKAPLSARLCALIAGLTLSGGALAQTLPATFDLRDIDGHSYIGPVHHQGSVGTCYAFGALASAESAYNRATGRYDNAVADFSESFLVWSLSPLYAGFSGGIYGSSYTYDELDALVRYGVCDESEFPYTKTDPGEDNLHWDAPRVRFSSWHRLPAYDIETMKRALLAGGAIDTGIDSTPDGGEFDYYTGGTYRVGPNCTDGLLDYCSNVVDHAVAIIGWDDAPAEGGAGVWIVRNSWGTNWGEAGHIRMGYHSSLISTDAAYLLYNRWTGDNFDTLLSEEIEATPTTAGGITQTHGFYAWGGNEARLVNEARVTSIAEAETGDAFSHGLFLWGGIRAILQNRGTVRSAAIADTGLATAYGLCLQGAQLINFGRVSTRVIGFGDERATAYGARLFAFIPGALFTNSGDISVRADGSNAWAIGVQVDDAHFVNNTGTINANGTARATGIIACNIGTIENYGDIETYSAAGPSVGVYLENGALRNHAGARIVAENNDGTSIGVLATGARVVNNGLIQGSVHRLVGSEVYGNGLFNGTLELTHCALYPGDRGIGQLQIDGDLLVQDGLGMEIVIGADGYSQVLVSGEAHIGDDNVIHIYSKGYMPAGEYAFLRATEASGSFGPFDLPIMYDGSISVGTGGFILDLDRLSYASFTDRTDLGGLGVALDHLRPTATGSLGEILEELDATDAPEFIGQALADMQPAINAATTAAALQGVHRTGAQITHRAQTTPRADRPAAFGASAWFGILDGRERRAATTGFGATGEDTDGALVGIEFSPGNRFTLGAAYADARQYVTDLDSPAHARIDSHRGYLYGRWTQRNDESGWAASTHLGLGSSRIQTSRTVAFIDGAPEGTHRARDLSAALGASYGLRYRALTLRPFLDAEFVRLDERAYTETGDSGVELTFPRQHEKSFLAGAGLSLSARIGLGRFALIPEASVRQSRDFSADSRGLAAAFDGGEVFLAPGRDLPKEQTDVSFALRAQFADRLAATIRYTHTGYSRGHDYAETVAGQFFYAF